MTVNIWSVLLLFGICQGGLLVALIVLRRSGTKSADFFLAALILVVSLNLLSYLVVATELYRDWPHLIVFFQPFLFLIGPLFFFYVSCTAEGGFRPRLSNLLHLVPFLMAVAFRSSFLLQSAPFKIASIDAYRAATTIEMPVEFFLYFAAHVLQTFAYVFSANRKLGHPQVGETGVPEGTDNLAPLRVFGRVFGGYWVAALISLVLLTFAQAWTHEIDYGFVLVQSFIVHAAGYLALNTARTYPGGQFSHINPARSSAPLLPVNQGRVYARRLQQYMEETRPYLRTDLSLAGLAQGIGLSNHVVSHVINRYLGRNFADFVNGYRVDEVQKRLLNPEKRNLTILALAFESGFSSKASFNRAFKSHVGQTPSQFLRDRNGDH